MKKSFGEYQRLARSSLGFSSLWKGGDHLLYIKGSGVLLPFTEEYKRFRYGDIQTLVISPTAGLWLGVLGYLAGLLVVGGIGFGMLFSRDPDDAALLVATLTVPLPLFILLLLLLVRHLLLGPRCRLDIQTALKTERIRAVSRLHQGKEAVERLAPRILEAQQRLPTSSTASSSEAPEMIASVSPAPPLTQPPLVRPAFLLASFFATALLLLLHFPDTWVSGLFLLVGIAAAVPLQIALAGSVRHRAPEAVRTALWLQLVTGGIIAGVLAVFYVDQAINDPGLTLGVMGPIEAFADISILGGPAFYLVFLIAGLAHLGVAILGLIQAGRWDKLLQTAPPPPQSPGR